MIPVNSTSIAAVAYDKERRELSVKFVKGGKVYTYYEVPERVYDEFIKAPSIGKYFNAHIKKYSVGA